MAKVQNLRPAEALEGANWVVVERVGSGKFSASGISMEENAFFGPFPYANERDAVGAAQTWAFHNSVPVIYVRDYV